MFLQRGRVIEEANIILTNPDMLHASVLPGHKRFSRILSNLSHVVIDEVWQETAASKSKQLYMQPTNQCAFYVVIGQCSFLVMWWFDGGNVFSPKWESVDHGSNFEEFLFLFLCGKCRSIKGS